jgi:hypothetical protein
VPDFERVVNGGDAVRRVFIAGVPVVEDGEPLPTLGQQRTGRFLPAQVRQSG